MTRPGFVDRFNAIADATLPTTQKAVLWALLRFADGRTGVCWPSTATLAGKAGLSKRALRTTMRKLQAAKLVKPVGHAKGGVGPNGRGYTRQFQLDLSSLGVPNGEPENPAPDAGLNPARGAAEPGTKRLGTRPDVPPNPAPRADKPSIQPSTEPTTEPSTPEPMVQRRPDHECMDGRASADPADVRQKLRDLGVQGPNLDRLSQSPAVTAEVIDREVRAIRQSGPTVRSLPAVLVKRLAVHAGVPLGTRSPLTEEMRATAASLEEIRRRRLPNKASA